MPTRACDSPTPLSTSSAGRATRSASRPRASTHTNPPRRSSVTTRGATVRRAGARSARESATVRQTGLQRQTNIVRCHRDRDVRARVPPRRARAHPDRRRLRLHRLIERPATPPIAVRNDLRLQAKLCQRRMRRHGHERTAPLADGAREADRLRALRLRTVEHYEREPATTQQLLGAPERVLATFGLHEIRTLLPERADDRSRRVDPHG